MLRKTTLGLTAFLLLAGVLPSREKTADGWIKLFNGKDLTGWKLHWPNPSPLTKFATMPRSTTSTTAPWTGT